jgi:hypothetical protein
VGRLAVALVVIAAARVVAAQPAPELTREFQAGVDAYRLGKYDEARAHLEKARALDPSLPGPYRFLAAVAQAQSKWQECIDDARAAVAANPRSQEIADTRKLHDACRLAAGRAPFRGELGDSAALAVIANVPGATVLVGGIDYGGTPIEPRAIATGPIDVVIKKDGWKTQTVNVEALGGIVTDVVVELEPDFDATPKGTGDIDTKPVGPAMGKLQISGSSTGTDVRVDGKPFDRRKNDLAPGQHVVEVIGIGTDPWRRRVNIVDGKTKVVEPQLLLTKTRQRRVRIGYLLLGGAGALAIGGFAFALASEAAAAEARDILRVETQRDPTQPLSTTGAIEPVRTRADFDHATHRASVLAIHSDIAYSLALASAGVGAYFLIKGNRDRDDIPPPFAIAPLRGGAIVAKEIAW